MNPYSSINSNFIEFSSILGLPLWLNWLRICLQCRRPGFNPWSGKVSHAVGQLSLCATVLGPCSRACEPKLLNLRTKTTEARAL